MVWVNAGDGEAQVKEKGIVIPVSVEVIEVVVYLVVVETLGLLVVVVELFGDIEEVVNGETGSPVGLPVGQ